MRVSLFLFYSAPVGRGTRTASACSFYPGGSSFLHRLRGVHEARRRFALTGGSFFLHRKAGVLELRKRVRPFPGGTFFCTG